MFKEEDLPAGLRGKTWNTTSGKFTSRDLVSLLDCIHKGEERFLAFPDAWSNSDRRVDRATQLLRHAGLIECSGKWRCVCSGPF